MLHQTPAVHSACVKCKTDMAWNIQYHISLEVQPNLQIPLQHMWPRLTSNHLGEVTTHTQSEGDIEYYQQHAGCSKGMFSEQKLSSFVNMIFVMWKAIHRWCGKGKSFVPVVFKDTVGDVQDIMYCLHRGTLMALTKDFPTIYLFRALSNWKKKRTYRVNIGGITVKRNSQRLKSINTFLNKSSAIIDQLLFAQSHSSFSWASTAVNMVSAWAVIVKDDS